MLTFEKTHYLNLGRFIYCRAGWRTGPVCYTLHLFRNKLPYSKCTSPTLRQCIYCRAFVRAWSSMLLFRSLEKQTALHQGDLFTLGRVGRLGPVYYSLRLWRNKPPYIRVVCFFKGGENALKSLCLLNVIPLF